MTTQINERIEIKIDKLADDITDIKVTMARNTGTLEEHVKRTNALEKKVFPIWVIYKLLIIGASGILLTAALTEILQYFKK